MEKGSRKNQYLVTLSVSLVFVTLGTSSAWVSPVMPKFTRNETKVDINHNGISWIVSMNPIGFILGSFVTRYISDNLGRRATILISAAPMAIGSIICVFALKAWLLCVTILLWNCATGMVSTVIGIYFAEISDKDIRATLALYTRVSFNLGHLIIMSVGPNLRYETINYIVLSLPFVYFVCCWWIPETPYYLLKEGRVDDARMELQRLRGYKDVKSLEDEMILIQSSVKTDMTRSSTAKELFTGKQYRNAIIVATGIKFTQIMTGGVIIKQYLGVIMQECNLNADQEKIVFSVFGIISFIVCLISSIFVDKVGRRQLLITSYIGTGLSLTIVGIFQYLPKIINISPEYISTYAYIPFVGIILSNVISTFGFIALSSVIPAEIFPLNIKAVAMTSLSVFGGVLGFILSKGYQSIKEYLGPHTVFWIFGTVSFFGAVFTYVCVPETRGKNLNDIQRELQGTGYDGGVALDENVDEGTELETLNRVRIVLEDSDCTASDNDKMKC